ncbi:hypothetical protein QOZ80_5BG0447790 [Eleusine coracana subsp. coracana]|nr:hypothetical protein QOZ80_5BG0447790 [Eleusine coracana subsp. coracana]
MEKKPMEERMEDGNKEDDLVFPGFRFHPTDQELLGFYLKRKMEGRSFSIDIIKEMDIYKHDPWDLPSVARQVVQGAGEKEWYFFCLRGRKYRNSIRPNRVTGSGFWKATGIDKPVHDGAGAGECVGLKKSLVYYRGSAGRGTKTDWMMHEFRLPSTSSADFQDAEIWTICRIFKRKLSYNRRFQQQIKQEQGGNKRISHQLQKQLEYNHHHQLFYTGCASTASSFESTTTDVSEASHAIDHSQTFLLHSHSLHGASPEDMMKVKKPATSPSAVAWSELTSFVQDGSSTWDELGRILEVSTDM